MRRHPVASTFFILFHPTYIFFIRTLLDHRISLYSLGLGIAAHTVFLYFRKCITPLYGRELRIVFRCRSLCASSDMFVVAARIFMAKSDPIGYRYLSAPEEKIWHWIINLKSTDDVLNANGGISVPKFHNRFITPNNCLGIKVKVGGVGEAPPPLPQNKHDLTLFKLYLICVKTLCSF